MPYHLSLSCSYSVQNCKIHHSVVGLRSCIAEGAIIEDTLLMGADYYEVIPQHKLKCWVTEPFHEQCTWSLVRYFTSLFRHLWKASHFTLWHFRRMQTEGFWQPRVQCLLALVKTLTSREPSLTKMPGLEKMWRFVNLKYTCFITLQATWS